MTSVGSVSVDVVPSVRDFASRLRAEMLPAADAAGREAGKTIGDKMADGVKDGLTKASAEAEKKGATAGGRFADSFKARVEAALKALPDIKIDADSSPADRKIAELRGQLKELSDKRVGVDIDAATARTKLDAIKVELDELGAKSPDIRIRVDAARASAELLAFHAQLEALEPKLEVVGESGSASLKKVEQSAASASGGGGVGGLIAAGIALGPALIPVAGAVVAALAAVGTAAAGAAAGAGVAFLALQPVLGAVQALNAQRTAGITSQSPSARLAASLAISGAQQGLSQAEAGAINARASAANAQISSAQAVSDALRSQGDVQQQVAVSIAAAQLQVVNSEQSLASAQYQEVEAQRMLTLARKDAQQQLEDYKNQLLDGALAERAATLATERARINLRNTLGSNGGVSQLQKDEAQLAYDQAVQHAKDLAVQQGRLKTQADIAAKAGVDGALNVVAATHAVEMAHQSTGNAAAAVTRAQEASDRAQSDGAEHLATAQEAVTTALRAQAEQARTSAASLVSADLAVQAAQRGVEAAYRQAGAAGVAAAEAVSMAFLGLSPAGQTFARFIFGLRDSFTELSKAAQTGMLPGLQSFIEALLPYLPRLVDFVGTLAKTMGDLFVEAGKALTGPFWTQFFDFLAGNAGGWLTTFAHTFGDILKGAAGLFQALAPVGDLLNGAIAVGAKAFADWATHLATNKGFQEFLQYIVDNAPLVGQLFGSLVELFGALVKDLAPLGPPLIILISALAHFIAQLTPEELGAILVSVGAVLATLGGAPVLGAILGITGLAIVVGDLLKNNKDLGRDMGNTWKGIIDSIVGAWNVVGPILRTMLDFYMTQIFPTVSKLWTDVFKPAFTEIGQIVSLVWSNIILPVLSAMWSFLAITLGPVISWLWTNVVKPSFEGMGAIIEWVWVNVTKPALDAFKRGLEVLPETIRGVRDSIGSIWEKIADTIKGPLNTVLSFIQDHFISPLQSLLDALHIDLKLPKIPQFAMGGYVGANADALAGYAGGGYTGDGGKYQPMGVVHGGEYVINKESTAKIMQESPGLLAGLNGYDAGGFVSTIGSAFQSAKDFVSNGISGISAFVTDPLGAMKGFVDGILGGLGDSPFPKIASAVLSQVGDSLAQLVLGSSQQNTANGGMGGAPGTAGAVSAVSWALGEVGTGGWLDRCLAFVNAAWGHQIPWLGLPRAIDAWNAAPQHPGDVNAPGGAALFYLTGNPAGHVDLAIGDGSIVSTDLPTANLAGHVGFNTPMSQWGAKYLGWAMPGYDAGGYVKPLLFDSGGYLPTGISVVQNDTGAPEPLRRADQGGTFRDLIVQPAPGMDEFALASAVVHRVSMGV